MTFTIDWGAALVAITALGMVIGVLRFYITSIVKEYIAKVDIRLNSLEGAVHAIETKLHLPHIVNYGKIAIDE